MSAPVGGILALWLTGTPFSVSSGIGFLALFGVSVQTALVYISYVNELRLAGIAARRCHPRSGDPAPASDHDDRAGRRARPASRCARDRRRHRHPAAFAVVIVGGLITCLAIIDLPDARALYDRRAGGGSAGGLTSLALRSIPC